MIGASYRRAWPVFGAHITFPPSRKFSMREWTYAVFFHIKFHLDMCIVSLQIRLILELMFGFPYHLRRLRYSCASCLQCFDTVGGRKGIRPVKNGGWWRWYHCLVRMEWRPGGGVSASVSLPLHHKVQKFSSGTVSPGWSRKKGRKTVMVWWLFQSTTFTDRDEIWRTSGTTVKLWYGMLFRVQNIMSLIWVLLPPTPSLQDNIWNATLWCTLSCEISGWLYILSPLRAKIANFTKIWIMGAHIYSPPHHRSVPVKFGVWERTHDVFFHTKFLIEQCIVSHLSDDKKQIQPHLQVQLSAFCDDAT